VIGHPALLMPLAVALGIVGADASPQLLQAALTTALLVAVIVGLYSLWQVRAGRWAHVDASQPRERSQLNLFLALLLFGAAGLLWALSLPLAVASGAGVVALLVLAAHLLRRWLKVSLHAAFAVFAASLVWPSIVGVVLILALAAGVAWSRLALRRHTLPEVLLGLLLGAAFGAGFRLAIG
jgi:phosphotransferase system  glucose/maltose/N-acetylglucosamine-specific IIC component